MVCEAGGGPEVKGDYHRAETVSGLRVDALLFETFGAFSPEVVELLRELREERGNKLAKSEYDLATWSTRNWLTFTRQKLSVAVHLAAANEIGQALGLAHGADTRD